MPPGGTQVRKRKRSDREVAADARRNSGSRGGRGGGSVAAAAATHLPPGRRRAGSRCRAGGMGGRRAGDGGRSRPRRLVSRAPTRRACRDRLQRQRRQSCRTSTPRQSAGGGRLRSPTVRLPRLRRQPGTANGIRPRPRRTRCRRLRRRLCARAARLLLRRVARGGGGHRTGDRVHTGRPDPALAFHLARRRGRGSLPVPARECTAVGRVPVASASANARGSRADGDR